LQGSGFGQLHFRMMEDLVTSLSAEICEAFVAALLVSPSYLMIFCQTANLILTYFFLITLLIYLLFLYTLHKVLRTDTSVYT
jgi:hypothetical protein